MSNRITIRIEFDFKGQHHTPSAEFDLDDMMRTHGDIPDLYSTIASLNNIGHYSYEYEMMQAEEMQFSNAQGMVTQYLQNGVFDKAGFIHRWHQEEQTAALQSIAQQHMGISDLDANPELKSALFAAYQRGKDD